MNELCVSQVPDDEVTEISEATDATDISEASDQDNNKKASVPPVHFHPQKKLNAMSGADELSIHVYVCLSCAERRCGRRLWRSSDSSVHLRGSHH